MHLVRQQLETIVMLRECTTVALVCSSCGWKEEWNVQSSKDINAFLAARRLREFREELFPLQKVKELFDRFPDSLHPFKIATLHIKMEDGSLGRADPMFEAAMRQDEDVYKLLVNSSFYLPARLEFVMESIEEYEAVLRDSPQAHCPSCSQPTLEIPESFIREQFAARSQT